MLTDGILEAQVTSNSAWDMPDTAGDIPRCTWCGENYDHLRQFGEQTPGCWMCDQVDREMAELEARFAQLD